MADDNAGIRINAERENAAVELTNAMEAYLVYEPTLMKFDEFVKKTDDINLDHTEKKVKNRYHEEILPKILKIREIKENHTEEDPLDAPFVELIEKLRSNELDADEDEINARKKKLLALTSDVCEKLGNMQFCLLSVIVRYSMRMHPPPFRMHSFRKNFEDVMKNCYLKDLKEEEEMKVGRNLLMQGDVPSEAETRSEMELHNILRLENAKLAAKTILEMISDELNNSEEVYDRKRILKRISAELTSIREETNCLFDNNSVDLNCHKKSIDVVEQVKKTEYYIHKNELLRDDSSQNVEFLSCLMEYADTLKDRVNDLSMECRRVIENKKVFEELIEPTTTSTPILESFPSSPPQNLSQIQQVLEKFCNAVIQFSKQQFKNLKLSNTDGSKAYALRHFLKIESDILNFQMKTALKSLKSPDSELDKPIFGQITSEVSHGNQKIIETHLERMKQAKKEMILVKSDGTSTVIPELAFWLLSFQNSKEELGSMGIKPIFGEDGNSFERQIVCQILRFLFEIRLDQSNGENISRCNYAVLLLLESIKNLSVANYDECIGKKNEEEEAIAGTSSQI